MNKLSAKLSKLLVEFIISILPAQDYDRDIRTTAV